VVLVDKNIFPRDKPCGGALSALAVDCLTGMGLDGWAQRYPAWQELRFFGPRGRQVGLDMRGRRRGGYFIPRFELDAALCEAATGAGVRLLQGVPVTGASIEARWVSLQAAGDVPRAKILILAEGAVTALADSLRLTKYGPNYMAVRAIYQYEGPAAAELHFLPGVLPCTAWAYPAGAGRVSVGLAGELRDINAGRLNLEAALADFVERHALGGALAGKEAVVPLAAAPIRSRLGSVRPYGTRVLLAGEAAGVVHPMTLQGIGAAMESGRIVAQHALYALEKGQFGARDLSAYALALQRRFGVEYRAARVLNILLHSERVIERLIGRAQRDPGFASLMASVYVGTQSALGTLTPANLGRYLMWWRQPRRRRRG